MDRFRNSRCLDNHPGLFNKIGSFASSITSPPGGILLKNLDAETRRAGAVTAKRGRFIRSAQQQLSAEFQILKIRSVLTKLQLITYRYSGRLDFLWELIILQCKTLQTSFVLLRQLVCDWGDVKNLNILVVLSSKPKGIHAPLGSLFENLRNLEKRNVGKIREIQGRFLEIFKFYSILCKKKQK